MHEDNFQQQPLQLNCFSLCYLAQNLLHEELEFRPIFLLTEDMLIVISRPVGGNLEAWTHAWKVAPRAENYESYTWCPAIEE